MKIRIFTIVVLCLCGLHCDLGQTLPPEPLRNISQTPWVAGRITSASEYPPRPISLAEVSVSWASGHASTYTDTSGRFRIQQLPRAVVTFRATTIDRDTVTLTLNLITSDTATVDAALKIVKGFLPGRICVGIQDTTSLHAFVGFADSRGLPIRNVSSFTFVTDSLTADSLVRVQSILAGKPYVTGASSAVRNGRVSVWSFSDLTPYQLRDWEATCSQVGFHEIPSSAGKFAVLLVSPGSEHGWIWGLSGESLLSYICLDLLARIW